MRRLSTGCVDAAQLTSGSSVIWLDGCLQRQYFFCPLGGGVEPRCGSSVESGTLLGPEGSARQSWFPWTAYFLEPPGSVSSLRVGWRIW